VPRGFWENVANHKLYFDWLGGELNVKTPEDWNRVTIDKVAEHGGSGLLMNYYNNSLSKGMVYNEIP
jgi:hypothetical protein